MLDVREVKSLTDFEQNARSYLARMWETGEAVMLTVDGRAEVVIQDAEAYQQSLDRFDHAETVAALRVALVEDSRGEAVPAREALEALGRRHGLSR